MRATEVLSCITHIRVTAIDIPIVHKDHVEHAGTKMSMEKGKRNNNLLVQSPN
jgi:hypothetical protein